MKIITPEEALVLNKLGVGVWWQSPYGDHRWWFLKDGRILTEAEAQYPKAWGIEDAS